MKTGIHIPSFLRSFPRGLMTLTEPETLLPAVYIVTLYKFKSPQCVPFIFFFFLFRLQLLKHNRGNVVKSPMISPTYQLEISGLIFYLHMDAHHLSLVTTFSFFTILHEKIAFLCLATTLQFPCAFSFLDLDTSLGKKLYKRLKYLDFPY